MKWKEANHKEKVINEKETSHKRQTMNEKQIVNDR